MKKFQSLFRKYSCNAMAFVLTAVATGIATCGCYFVYYQPEVPDNLKKFSKNK
ncbi:MAG: cyclic lactone autoinducer peptide [Lachnospiraceae bacterium]|nr:cyclic lactone autoinducer peptide [Lachnospiraceae bacterium]